VLVRCKPAYSVGGEWPVGFHCGEREETTVGYAPAVVWFVGNELGVCLRVDAVAGDEEVCGYGSTIFEGEGDFIGAGVLVNKISCK